jgi:hypothetical protein
MFSAQHDNIKGTTSGAPGTGSFTPNAAATGARAWSNVAAGWIGVVRFEDGTDWGLSYCYWNGTALTRPSAGFIDSSTGSQLSLTSAATAALVVSADAVATPIGSSRLCAYIAPASNGSAFDRLGFGSPSTSGTLGFATLATTNFLTEQVAVTFTSTTGANAIAGFNNGSSGQTAAVYSTTAGRGGFDFSSRFGALTLPTGPRLWIGLTNTALTGIEPSAVAGSFAAFGKDSTDTNIQFMTKDGTTAGKTDTGITLTAGAFYLARIWAAPGGGKVYGLLIRWDTGDIWYGSRTTNLPANGSLLFPEAKAALNGTNTGTAVVLHVASLVVRNAN